MKKLFKIGLFVFLGFVVIGVIAGIAGGGGAKKPAITTTPTPTQSQDPAPKKAAPAPKPAPAPKQQADSVTGKLDDQSVVDGSFVVDNIYANFTVVNHSSKASDYDVNYQVTLPNGTRVDSGEAYVLNVQPGQTAKDQEYLLQATHKNVQDGATVSVTSVDRTADATTYGN